jgi:hypothetical protein
MQMQAHTRHKRYQRQAGTAAPAATPAMTTFLLRKTGIVVKPQR